MVEQAKPVGLTKDVGWQIGVRRTLSVHHDKAWRLLTSKAGMKLWLNGTPELDFIKGETYELADGSTGEVRVFHPGSHLRMTWQPPDWPRASLIQVRIIPKRDRTVIAFHQEHLPGPEAREDRRAHFTAVMDELESLLAAG